MLTSYYNRLIAPNSATEHTRRREYILNILLTIVIGLSFIFCVVAFTDAIIFGEAYEGAPLYIPLGALCTFIILLVLSKHKHPRFAAYIFVVIFFVLATYPTYIWGILLPQGILTYGLVIVMAGVLISSRWAFRIATLMFFTLLLIEHLSIIHLIHFDSDWMQNTGGYNDVVAYGVTFMALAFVSGLSNREIERSLLRARKSEKALRLERNSLEEKVQERTEELKKSHIENMLELHRFAEFGRYSSTLLHEITNPLTAVSLNLERMESTQQSKLLKQVRVGINFMEEYVDAARRQLRIQSEIKEFDVAEEIQRVNSLLASKASGRRLHLTFKLAPKLLLRGDSIKFDQVVANLIANAIDAYDDTPSTNKKVILITSKHAGGHIEIKISDKGVGIAPTELKKIFDPFFTTKTSLRGTGIGLAITKQIVEDDFGGNITVQSEVHKGTDFTLRLPLL